MDGLNDSPYKENNGKCEENLVKVFVFIELLDVSIATANIDFLCPRSS